MCSRCPFCGSTLTLPDLFRHLRQACVVFTVVADAIDDALYDDPDSDEDQSAALSAAEEEPGTQ